MQARARQAASHPLVGEVRGSGLIAGLELVEDKAARRPFDPQLKVGARIFALGHEHGLIVRAIGDTIALCPPMIITEAQVLEMLARLQNDARRSGRGAARGRRSIAEEVRIMHTELLIGKQAGSGAGSGRSGPQSAHRPDPRERCRCHAGQVDAAVNAATKAFEKWSLTTPVERAGYIFKIADLIEREADAFAELEAQNTGKPKHLMLRDEIPAIADCFRFFGGAVRCMHGPVAAEYLAGHTSMIRRDPLGRNWLDRAVELPAHDGRVENRARHRGRQHHGTEAFRTHADDDTAAGQASGGDPAGRRASISFRARAARWAMR